MNRRLSETVVRLSRNLIECTPHQFKHFSFAIKRNAIYSVGWNKPWQTHPLGLRFHHKISSIHSEISCLSKLNVVPAEFSKFTIINVRLDKEGTVRLSKPCQCCQNMLAAFGITEVYYSSNSGGFEKL
jgi:deoxycytidylate deaminase